MLIPCIMHCKGKCHCKKKRHKKRGGMKRRLIGLATPKHLRRAKK